MNQPFKRGMKAKTIRQVIQKQLDNWANSVRCEDEEKKAELQNIIKTRTVVTGGCIASMLLGEDVNDFDIYFRDKESAIKLVNHYLAEFLKADLEKEKAEENNNDEDDVVNGEDSAPRQNDKVSRIEARETERGVKLMIKSAGVLDENVPLDGYRYFEGLPQDVVERYFSKPRYYENKEKFYPTMFTDNAITFTDKIQVILRFVGEPENIHENYDFVHCKNYFIDGKLYLDKDAMEALLARELRYVGSLFPVCSLFRIRKFLTRGWTIMASEVFKIAYDVSKLNLDEASVLEDQLMGVDYAYFNEVISILRKDQENGKELNRTYLFELVNRVFDDLPEVPLEDE